MIKGIRYVIHVNGKRKYKRTFSQRMAQYKAAWLQQQGYARVEVIEEVVAAGANKFGAIPTELDGIKFDSRAEANYYAELKILQRVNVVREIQLKPRYVLLAPYLHPRTHKLIKGIEYVADFLVTYVSGREEIIDVKSVATRTAVYKIKKKLFESKYGKEIVEVER